MTKQHIDFDQAKTKNSMFVLSQQSTIFMSCLDRTTATWVLFSSLGS